MFKAEPVDRYGNLIDRHNLWEMVGVRYRRAIFPGFSDVANYSFSCPSGLAPASGEEKTDSFGRDFSVGVPRVTGTLYIRATLDYRKIDQYLLDFVFGEENELTSPVVQMAEDEMTVIIEAS
jgi:hypothetical protein